MLRIEKELKNERFNSTCQQLSQHNEHCQSINTQIFQNSTPENYSECNFSSFLLVLSYYPNFVKNLNSSCFFYNYWQQQRGYEINVLHMYERYLEIRTPSSKSELEPMGNIDELIALVSLVENIVSLILYLLNTSFGSCFRH